MQALITEVNTDSEEEHYKLIALKVCSETGETPNATVTVKVGDKEFSADSEGSGAVDAGLKAIDFIVKSGASLEFYSVNSITNGTDAQGEVTVRLEKADA